MGSQAVGGSAQEWREALTRYYPRVRAWFVHVLADRAAVDDLTQEVFVRLVRRLNTGEMLLEPWSFIKVTARNVFMEHLRAQRKRKAFDVVEDAEAVDPLPQPAEVCAHQEALEAIPNLLGHLSASHRTILVGRYFMGMTVRELAEALGIAAATVVERHHAALCTLRKLSLDRGLSL